MHSAHGTEDIQDPWLPPTCKQKVWRRRAGEGMWTECQSRRSLCVSVLKEGSWVWGFFFSVFKSLNLCVSFFFLLLLLNHPSGESCRLRPALLHSPQVGGPRQLATNWDPGTGNPKDWSQQRNSNHKPADRVMKQRGARCCFKSRGSCEDEFPANVLLGCVKICQWWGLIFFFFL